MKKKRKFSSYTVLYKEIQSGAVAKSYIWKGFLIYEEMQKYFPIYEEAVSHIHMTLQLLHSEFPYTVYEENLIFFLSVCGGMMFTVGDRFTLRGKGLHCGE
jgi:hypothetical protein